MIVPASVRETPEFQCSDETRRILESLAIDVIFSQAMPAQAVMKEKYDNVLKGVNGFSIGDNYLFALTNGEEGRAHKIISSLPREYQYVTPARQAYLLK